VISKRTTASGQTAPEDQPARIRRDGDAHAQVDGLTRAQARALSRCAPLTPEEFRARRRVAEQSLVSLRAVLHEAPDTSDARRP
jgi:hypothetical protein